MLRVAPRYEALAILQEQYLLFVDGILAAIADPGERYAAIEEMRRQLGCLLGELGDRKIEIQKEIEYHVDHHNEARGAATPEPPLGGRVDGASPTAAARKEPSPDGSAAHKPRSRRWKKS